MKKRRAIKQRRILSSAKLPVTTLKSKENLSYKKNPGEWKSKEASVQGGKVKTVTYWPSVKPRPPQLLFLCLLNCVFSYGTPAV